MIYFFCFNEITNAEVIEAGENGFAIQIIAESELPRSEVYKQFVHVDKWWDAEHSYFGRRENFSLELKAGGCFCEIDGENQVLHMTVTMVNPGQEIRMVGGLGPLQMMGANGGMFWKFEELENGGTKIIHEYKVSGYLEGGFTKLAPIVDRVQQGQINSLIEWLNNQ